MCIASGEGDFQMGFVRHTFFRGYDKRLTSAFISNQHPRYFLEISLNSCLIRLDQLSMACTGKIPQKICFKYNIFDTIRRVFFRGSMASNISLGLDAGSPSSSFGWSSFFFFYFSFLGEETIDVCFLLFILLIFFVSSFCFSFIPAATLYLIFTRFCDTRISHYQVWSAMTRYGYIWLVIPRYDKVMIRCMTN